MFITSSYLRTMKYILLFMNQKKKIQMYLMTKKIIELYENEKDIFDEEIEKITKSFFG